MKFVLLYFIAFILNTGITMAQTQNVPAEDENYKHSNTTVHRHNTTTFEEADSISLKNQRTHKSHPRTYIIVPSDTLPGNNVQGKKTKANYKNQFN